MTYLNWSLKLHIRLKTISILIPTHITHVYVQCHIHLCDSTWLNVFHILKFCWSNKKRFLSVLIVFGKSFIFAKISKISKTVLPCTGDLVASQSSSMPPVASLHRRFLQLIGRSMSSREKHLENFPKFWAFTVSWLGLATYSQVAAPITRLYRNFRDSLPDSLAGGPSSREKHLDIFFKILS